MTMALPLLRSSTDMSTNDNESEIAVDTVEHLGLIRHAVAEGIARSERRYIAGSMLAIAAGNGIAGLVWHTLGNDGMAAACAGALGLALCEYGWLRFTRPRSVKPWGAEQ